MKSVNEDFLGKLPYRINARSNIPEYIAMCDWCKAQGSTGRYAIDMKVDNHDIWYFEFEQDATLFALRWSGA